MLAQHTHYVFYEGNIMPGMSSYATFNAFGFQTTKFSLLFGRDRLWLFHRMSITPASDIAPNIVIDILPSAGQCLLPGFL
jgi:hypothetical protein